MRDRCVGLRELLVATTAFLLVLSACSGDEESVETSSTTSSTLAAAPVSSTTAPPSPSVTTTTSATTPALPVAGIGETVLVTADDGVYQIGPEGDVMLLVAGPIAYAVDDTQGGLLFQVDRGRTWEDGDSRSTIVWWIPRGASTSQELLVPTPGTGQRLSLHDAYPTDEGFAVLYVRHDGATPNVDMIDRLRRFDVPAREVTELYSQGAFEEGFGHVSTNGELIAGMWSQQIGSGCFIFDLDGQPTNLVPIEASDATSEDYVRGCRLSPDGRHLAFSIEEFQDNELQPPVLRLWDLIADTGTTTFVVPGSVGALRDIDLSATRAVATFGGQTSRQTLVFDLNAPESDLVALPITGRARFVDTPVDIAAPVKVGAGPNYYRYGDDGLYRVVDGIEAQLEARPVSLAVDDLMGGVIYRHPGNVSGDMWWLRAAATEPESLPVAGVLDSALVDGRPMLLVAIEDRQFQHCPNEGDYLGPPLALHDLGTGDQSFLFCHSSGPDGGRVITSLGDDTLVSVEWVAVGGMGTDLRFVFTDLLGEEMTVETNPVLESCEPCTLNGVISDDGSLLAYTLWPAAFWDFPSGDGDYASALAEWKTATALVPVDAAVVELASGRELWRKTLDPGVQLADFDGRYILIRPGYPFDLGPDASVIYDTWGIHQPVEVAGGVALIRQTPNHLVLRHDGLGVVSFGDPVDDVMAVLTEHFGAPTSDKVYESPFDVPSGSDNRGPDACHAAATGYVCFDYLRIAWWEDAGFWALFSDIEANLDGTPGEESYWVQVPASFQGYGYRGSDESASLYTAHGITVGSTTTDLLALGPIVAFDWDGCGWQAGFTISDEARPDQDPVYGLLDDQDFEAFEETGTPNRNAKVLSLTAGQSSSC